MRLLCLKALLPVVAFTMACHETTSPPAVLRSFVLESVDTQPVRGDPRVWRRHHVAEYWAGLTLYEEDCPISPRNTRQVHPTLPPREATDTAHYSYRIIGDSLSRLSMSDTAICAGPPSASSLVPQL